MLVIGSDSIFLNSCIVNWPGFFVGRLVAACVPMPGSGGTRPVPPAALETVVREAAERVRERDENTKRAPKQRKKLLSKPCPSTAGHV